MALSSWTTKQNQQADESRRHRQRRRRRSVTASQATAFNVAVFFIVAVSLSGIVWTCSAFSILSTSPLIRSATTAGPSVTAILSPFYGRKTSTMIASSSASSSERQATTSTSDSDSDRISNNNEIYLLDEVDSIFDCLDKNGDGEITPDELKMHLVDEMGYSTAYTEYLFDSIDTDSNGSISREELGFAFYNFEALSMYMTLGMGGSDLTQRPSFQKLLLSDNSSKRDRLLLDDLADLIFDMIDTDNSGEITKVELRKHFEGVTKKLGEGSKAATIEQANEYVKTMFETLDVDQDGTICRDEVRAAFEKYDFKLLARTFGLRVYQSTN